MVLSETFQFSQLKDKIIQDQENRKKKREICERSEVNTNIWQISHQVQKGETN